MTASTPLLTIDGLRFSWHTGDTPLLALDALHIERGDRVFIRGPSGSGKTTLLNLLSGVLLPQQGSIRLLGTSLEKLKHAARDRFRADHIGFVFQMFNLIPYLPLIDNVTLPCRFSARRRQRAQTEHDLRAEAQRLLTHLGLTDKVLLKRTVSALSVGQQQRVAAARALIGGPELLIADEPTSALDTDARAAFLQLLFSECEQAGSTLVFVSHDQSLAPLFTRTLDLTQLNRVAEH